MAPLGIRSALAFSFALAATGCATIVGQPVQTIPIASTPSDASVVITDEAGAEVFKGSTPTTATLPKSTGKYWGKKNYTVTIAKHNNSRHDGSIAIVMLQDVPAELRDRMVQVR